MKLHATGPAPYNTITAYGEDYVEVNRQRYSSSLIVTAEHVLPWDVPDFGGITSERLENVKALAPEIVLLGTGPVQRFPHPRLTAPLHAAGIGVEVMDLKAACRTYNILVAEARKVAAALLFK